MDYTINQVKNLEYKVSITVPAEDVQKRIDDSLQEMKKGVSIPGFRKGKAPLSLIRSRYSKEVESEVLPEIIDESFNEIMKKEDYRIIGGGFIKTINWKANEPLNADVEFQVEPEIELKNIDNMRIIKEIHQVTEEDVNETLQQLQGQQAVIKPVEDGAKDGHYINADLQELDKSGMPIIGRKHKDRYFRLGSGIYGEKFDEQLQGVKKGDERSVEVNLESEQDKEDTEYYRMFVNKVEEQIFPELDDEFARSVGEFETLEQLKENIREQLKKRFAQQSEDQLYENLIDEVIKSNPFEVPSLMVDTYLHSWFEDVQKESKQKLNEKELKERNRPFAIRNIKWMLLRSKIVEQENLQVKDEDIEKYFQDMKKQTEINIDEIRSYYKKSDRMDDLKFQLEQRKVFDRLLETAEIEEVEMTDKKSKIIQSA